MEEVLAGLFLINGTDIYTQYGAFLAEEKEDGNVNYDSLLQFPDLKEQPKVSLQDEDGERTPDMVFQAYEARNITLQFAIAAPDARAFLTRYFAFMRFLKEGDAGWLTLRLPDVGLQFRVYLVSSPGYSQLVPFGRGEVAALFSVKFHEPQPTFELAAQTDE